MRLARAQLIIG